MGDLSGKVAIVTGASRGIGRAIAERLSREGAKVAVNYNVSGEEAREVIAAIQSNGGQAVPVQANMGTVSDVRRMFQETLTAFDHIDILVNNHGIARTFASIDEVTEDDYDEFFSVNTKGPFFAIQEAARVFRDNGRIVNISTISTKTGFPGYHLYGPTKAALEQFTLNLRFELGARGITINNLLPGPIKTRMLDGVLATMPDGMEQIIVERTPLGRVGQPKDVGDVVAFLCSDDARWVTGQTFSIDGGFL